MIQYILDERGNGQREGSGFGGMSATAYLRSSLKEVNDMVIVTQESTDQDWNYRTATSIPTR